MKTGLRILAKKQLLPSQAKYQNNQSWNDYIKISVEKACTKAFDILEPVDI